MKFVCCVFLLCITAAGSLQKATAQSDTTKPVKVAIFIPLYADEAFQQVDLVSDKDSFPKKVLPGLEFYNGVMMAIDSLNQEHLKAEISIYDTKQTNVSLTNLLKKPELANTRLMIAAVTNTSELKIFADYASAGNIPFISATYPNYAGVLQNPNFVLLNSSFKTHVDALFTYIKRYYFSSTIIAITKKGATEDYIKNYFTDINKNPAAAPLKIKWINADLSNQGMINLAKNLDSTRKNIVFVASALESFGLNIVRTLSNLGSYQTTVLGMPTWNGIKNLDKPDCKNVEIVFTTPFLYYSQNISLSSAVNKRYKEKYYSRPSDMVFKGFETTYHYVKLLQKHRDSLSANLSDTSFTLFNAFKLEPVKIMKSGTKPDFFENKKIYFIKKQEGSVKSIISS